ncbi:MAG TPA: hypothetical protein DCO83_13115 [Mucilaginibacter sp.]|jgi:hypothetical protein|nr:hypothetical protein [Mucilaginibacter sp.]
MLTEVGPNKTELWGRVISQIVMFLILGYFVYRLFNPHGIPPTHDLIVKGWIYAVLILSGNIAAFLQLYFLPFWVIIDDDVKTLEIKYLLKKPIVVGKHAIASYSNTTIKIRRSDCFGLFLHLSDGKRVLISDLTFDNYMPVGLFLSEINIKKKGDEDFSFFSYYRHQ